MTSQISVPKNLFYIICFALMMLIVAVILLWTKDPRPNTPDVDEPPVSENDVLIQDGVQLPIEGILKEYLDENKLNQAIFVGGTKDGIRIKWTTSEGKEPDICGRNGRNGKLSRKCRKQLTGVDVLAEVNASFKVIKINPNCTWGSVAGYNGLIHAGGDGYAYGLFPCHAGSH